MRIILPFLLCSTALLASAACNASASRPASHPAAEPEKIVADMIFIRGGSFRMGTGDGFAFEGPVHEITLEPFWIDKHEVTVGEFAKFVEATGYVTDAERFGWSAVFDVQSGEWRATGGSDWRHPEGPGSKARETEPVTQVSYNDATAYARWAGKRLPTEAEWEYAARGGLAGKKYAWSDELRPQEKWLANWWQGEFPATDTAEDGYRGRAPVGAFAPNGYGLYDMAGNVWEWCADWFDENYYRTSPKLNPAGPAKGAERVTRGGSWMCAENYCQGYRVAARSHSSAESAMNNLGFRCARSGGNG
ncbi:MAG TPA: formylglycine-generating enzyme family protein [Blastocatellia bacterium]|nr:formylglycine-generating enzyme family protein [Blastocatellia bacterium]